MSGSVVLRSAARLRPQAPDACLSTPAFHRVKGPAPLGGAPSLLTFTDASFVQAFLDGVGQSEAGWRAESWPRLVALRDWSEPPAAMFDASGQALYDADALQRRAPLPDEISKLADLDATDEAGPRWLRKLYLPIHQHFHVVSVELVCDRPERPPVDPARVVASGAVVRRLAPGGPGQGERWEDWVQTGKDRGIWVQIAGPDMRVGGAVLDPEDVRLPPTQAVRLAVARVAGGLKSGPVQLSSTRMMPLPPAVARRRTTRFAYVSVQSSEQEIPADPASTEVAAAALKENVGRELDAQIAPHLEQETSALRSAWDDLILAIKGADVDWSVGGPSPGFWGDRPTGAESTFPSTMAAAAVDRYNDERASPAVFRQHLIQAVRQAATRLTTEGKLELPSWNGSSSGADPDTGRASVVGEWIKLVWGASTLEPYAHRREFGIILRRDWGDLLSEARTASLAGPSGASYGWEAVFAAALTWVRAHRIRLARRVGSALPGSYPPRGVHPESRMVWDPLGSSITERVPVITVGSLSAEIDAWIAATDGEDDPPLSFSFTLPGDGVAVHRAAAVIEARSSRLLARAATAGGGFQVALNSRMSSLRSTGSAPRGLGLDLAGQPELGLLVFPTLGASALWAGLRATAVAHYDLIAGEPRPEVRAEGAARQVVVRPRFDPDHLYAIWCWARVRDGDPCVEDRVVWSARTEPFSLAEPLDLLGLKPAPMRLPDIPRLMRDLPRVARAGAAPYAMVTTPPDSGYVTGESAADTARQWGLAWVCSFGIPVFTICAWIMFSIIFSILILIPGFFWMLLLKFCIPVPAPRRAS